MGRTHPDAHRPFRAPSVPLVPILGIGTWLILMLSLPSENWIRLGAWLLIGFVIHFGYGRRHSVMARYTARRNYFARSVAGRLSKSRFRSLAQIENQQPW